VVKRQPGFTLVEVLVALVVMTVGMLGIAALYVEGLRMSRTSIYRMNAVNLAADMAERIRTNPSVPADYAGNGPGAENDCVNGVNACTEQELAEDDWWRWRAAMTENMPPDTAGDIAVNDAINGTDQYDITVTWPETGAAAPISYTLVVVVHPANE